MARRATHLELRVSLPTCDDEPGKPPSSGEMLPWRWVVSKPVQHTAEHTHDLMRLVLFWDLARAPADAPPCV
ncbi:MAG: hypothetical protein PVSMB4_03950 [Ktedonobacterales bacterium]